MKSREIPLASEAHRMVKRLRALKTRRDNDHEKRLARFLARATEEARSRCSLKDVELLVWLRVRTQKAIRDSIGAQISAASVDRIVEFDGYLREGDGRLANALTAARLVAKELQDRGYRARACVDQAGDKSYPACTSVRLYIEWK
jgi:hypothetical protein